MGLVVLTLLFLAGCASHHSSGSGSTPFGFAPEPDAGEAWQNAGAAPAPAPAGSAPPAPASTLAPGVTSIGGVASKPGYARPDLGWPRVFIAENATNTLYEPQVESWDNFLLKAQAAVSIQAAGAQDPVFGILHFQALTHVDKVERTVHFEDLRVEDAVFPSAPKEKEVYAARWLALLKANARSISLDRLEASLGLLHAEQKAQAVPILNPVPQFIFATTPTAIIQVQGEPVFRQVDPAPVERVINTRAFLAKTGNGQLYLRFWDGYLTASRLAGNWEVAKDVPGAVRKAEDVAVKEKAVDRLVGKPNPATGKAPSLKTDPVPRVRVVTVPTELVVFDGPADWLPLSGTDLLYVTNTVGNVFKCLTDQQTYVLVSGRWFRAPGFDGPWSFVPGRELPGAFAQIPVTSPKENVLASVPGTSQAQQAVIENGIPQSAKVDRASTAMPAPVFDGAPVIKPIEGTPLHYVANTVTPIIEVDGTSWYALQTGVWFAGASVNGPWVVATSVPAVIYSIPASSPLHYVTYVRIYSFNANSVWVGYTPGYYGTVCGSDGVVVYGTGYDYTPWIGTVYIAAPLTYGYYASLAWTPWAGWGYGFASGWAWGASWSYWCCSPCAPYWGPYCGWYSGAYDNGYGGVTAWGPGGWAATTGNMYSQWGNWSSTWRGGEGYNAFTGNAGAYRYGHAYNSVTGTMAAGQRGAVENVYTGNYAYGGRGAAYNPNTGATAAGSRYTVGNADSGRQATVGRGTVYDPATGKSTEVAGVKGTSGGVYNVNGQTVATHDGNVYRESPGGGYEKYNSDGSWSQAKGLDENRSLSSTASAQAFGAQRASSWENHGWQDSGGGWGGGDRPWGGGSGFGGDRSWGGGGGGFGGFRGGGFGGFRR